MKMTPHEVAAALLEIKERMEEALNDAEFLLRDDGVDSLTRARAESYWVGHMKAALGDHGYSSMCSMSDTIQELEGMDEEDEEEFLMDVDRNMKGE